MVDEVRQDTKMEKKKLDKPVENVEAKSVSTEKPREEVKDAVKPITDKKIDEKKPEIKKEPEKKEEKPVEVVVKGKFKEAVVNGRDLRISTKHAIAICNFIKNKDIDVAMKELGEVKTMKRAIPMRGEIPHRKGMMSGRYPIKASEAFIKLLKSLKSNAIYHELELEKLKLAAMPNVASRPQKRGGARFKRSHVQVKLIPITKIKKAKGKK
jgi:ribosomal protein L22